jgi:hypothetical protein
VSRYDEAGSSNSGNYSGFCNGVNRSLDPTFLSVNRATDSTRGTTPAIGNFHIQNLKKCQGITPILLFFHNSYLYLNGSVKKKMSHIAPVSPIV